MISVTVAVAFRPHPHALEPGIAGPIVCCLSEAPENWSQSGHGLSHMAWSAAALVVRYHFSSLFTSMFHSSSAPLPAVYMGTFFSTSSCKGFINAANPPLKISRNNFAVTTRPLALSLSPPLLLVLSQCMGLGETWDPSLMWHQLSG
jgi:hypothetical protein